MSVPPVLALPPGTRRDHRPTRGGPLAVLDTPARGVGRGTALLVPGFTGSKEDFVAVLGPLADRGWRVLAIDQRGQYESTGPDDETAYSVAALAADLVDLVVDLAGDSGGPVHLLGHSFGGLVARQAVTSLPDPGAAVATLTLLCSGPGALPPERQGPIPALVAALPATPLPDIWTAKEALDAAQGWPRPPEPVHAFLRRRFLASSPWGLRAMGHGLLTAPDEVDALAATGVPVLVAYGAGDDVWPLPEQDKMARRLSTTAVAIPGCAHSPAAEAPGPTAALLSAVWSSGDPAHGVGRVRPHGTGVGPAAGGYPPLVQIDSRLDHAPSAARDARRVVTDGLTTWGLDGLVEDTTLVVSELVTNAVQHARAPLGLRLTWAADVLRVEIRDGSPGALPLPRETGEAELDGRGMTVVGRLADRWGWDRDADGKTVWAELLAPATTG